MQTSRKGPKRSKTAHRPEGAEQNPFLARTVRTLEIKQKKPYQPGEEMKVLGMAGQVIDTKTVGIWKVQQYNAQQFVKVLAKGLGRFKELKSSGLKALEVVFSVMRRNKEQDKLYVPFLAVDQLSNPMSAATFIRGMNELIAAGIIYPVKMETNWYWLNPEDYWNGDTLVTAEIATMRSDFIPVQLATDQQALPFEDSENDDPLFDAELYARDPVFDKATQAELRRRAAEMDAGHNVVMFDPRGRSISEIEAELKQPPY
jgi:hypothetical protein